MQHVLLRRSFASLLAGALTILVVVSGTAQQPPQQQKQQKQPVGVPVPPLGEGPFILDTGQHRRSHRLRHQLLQRRRTAWVVSER